MPKVQYILLFVLISINLIFVSSLFNQSPRHQIESYPEKNIRNYEDFEGDEIKYEKPKTSNGYDTNLTFTESTELVFWGENLTYSVNFTFTDNGGLTWKPVSDPNAYCNLTIESVGLGGKIYVAENMTRGYGDGNFTLTLNSSRLSAGFDDQYYLIIVMGYHPTNNNPDLIINWTKVMAIPTGYAIYNYETRQLIADSTYTQVFNELINITVRYFKSVNQKELYGATMTYEWLNLGATQFYEDPVYDGFYTFTLNTSDVVNTGPQIIQITISLENYTMQQFLVSLRVIERLTTINGQSGSIYISKNIWHNETYNFTFEYRDLITSKIIGDLDIYSYIWSETNSTGDPTGNSGMGSLIQLTNKSYILDFNTENRPVSYFLIYATFHRDNYYLGTAIIRLNITALPQPSAIVPQDNDDDDDNGDDNGETNLIIFITATSSITLATLVGIYGLRKGLIQKGLKSLKKRLASKR